MPCAPAILSLRAERSEGFGPRLSSVEEAAVVDREAPSEALAAPRPVPRRRERVLLTGAAGMLGSELTPTLSAAGFEVFPRSRSDLDITDPAEVSSAFSDIRPDVVVNCAAFTKVDSAETDPAAFEVNARGVERLAQACRRNSARLVQVSTDFVFDGRKTSPYDEEDPVSPISAYGRSKRGGEEAALAIPSGLVVRASWLFGRSGWNFVEAILKQVGEGKTVLTVVADQRGRPTATADLAEAILGLLDADAVGVYHFANGGEVTWFDFAAEILEVVERPDVRVEPTTSSELARPAPRPAYSVLDTSKYERVTGRPIRNHREPLVEYLADRVRPLA